MELGEAFPFTAIAPSKPPFKASSGFSKRAPRRLSNGFSALSEFVRESTMRVNSMKRGVPNLLYGLDYAISMKDYLVPRRKDYPCITKDKVEVKVPELEDVDEDQSKLIKLRSTQALQVPHEGTIANPTPRKPQKPIPRSINDLDERQRARKFARCPGRPMIPQEYRNRTVYVSPITSLPTPLPIQLPSLKESQIIGTMETAEEEKSGHATARQVGDKDWQRQFRRKLEKTEREYSKKLKDSGYELKVVDGKQLSLLINDEKKQEEMRDKGDIGEGAGGEGEDLGTEARKIKSEKFDTSSKVMGLTEDTKNTDTKNTDRLRDAVNRLRETFDSFAAFRTSQTEKLLQSLYSMDADRLEMQVVKAKCLQPATFGAQPDVKVILRAMRHNAEKDIISKFNVPEAKRQYQWYRDLLKEAKRSDDRRNRYHPIIHFMFDYIRNVLEYGSIFDKHMFHTMLENISNDEYTVEIADLIYKIVRGIDQVKPSDVIAWFKETRGEAPAAFYEVLRGHGDSSAGGVGGTGNTFMTQRDEESALLTNAAAGGTGFDASDYVGD